MNEWMYCWKWIEDVYEKERKQGKTENRVERLKKKKMIEKKESKRRSNSIKVLQLRNSTGAKNPPGHRWRPKYIPYSPTLSFGQLKSSNAMHVRMHTEFAVQLKFPVVPSIPHGFFFFAWIQRI